MKTKVVVSCNIKVKMLLEVEHEEGESACILSDEEREDVRQQAVALVQEHAEGVEITSVRLL